MANLNPQNGYELFIKSVWVDAWPQGPDSNQSQPRFDVLRLFREEKLQIIFYRMNQRKNSVLRLCSLGSSHSARTRIRRRPGTDLVRESFRLADRPVISLFFYPPILSVLEIFLSEQPRTLLPLQSAVLRSEAGFNSFGSQFQTPMH
jgi:hypothetical protein